jgi:hypothetical protein
MQYKDQWKSAKRQIKHYPENLRLGNMIFKNPAPNRAFQNDKKFILPVFGYKR